MQRKWDIMDVRIYLILDRMKRIRRKKIKKNGSAPLITADSYGFVGFFHKYP